MNAQQLYDMIKDARDFFGLRFSEFHLMQVKLRPTHVTFEYEGNTVIIKVPDNQNKDTQR